MGDKTPLFVKQYGTIQDALDDLTIKKETVKCTDYAPKEPHLRLLVRSMVTRERVRVIVNKIEENANKDIRDIRPPGTGKRQHY